MKTISLLVFIFFIASAKGSESTDKKSVFTFLWRPAYRPTYLYYQNTQATTYDVLLNRHKNEPMKEQYGVEPYRIEAEWKKESSENMMWIARFMGGLSTLHYGEHAPGKSGVEGWLDFGASFKTQVSWADMFETIAVARTYYSAYTGDVHDRGNFGFAIGIKPTWNRFSFLLEVSSQSMPFLVPNELGAQQSASALRLRGEYAYPMKEGLAFISGVELFHSKADFSGADENNNGGIYWDDLQLSLLLGVRKTL